MFSQANTATAMHHTNESPTKASWSASRSHLTVTRSLNFTDL